MSYTIPSGCRDRFTAEQARRMHAHLNGHPMLAPLPIAPPDTFPAGSPAGISGDIIILSGEFVINSPLEMMPGASITVKPGATLRVKSAITGACGQMWEGITVEGDIFEPQSPATHGKVAVMGNGLIENAICGIRASDGGIVEVWGGDFRNNATSIQFDTYPFTNASLLYFGFFTISLLLWLDQCWEPGFLAANLLRRNGLSAEPPCLGEEPHYRQLPVWELPTSEIQPNGNIRLYPNPAQDKLFLELPSQAGSAEVRLYSMQGALVRRWRLGGGGHDLLLGGQDIRPGFYVAEVRTSHGEIFRQKVILSY